MRTVVYTFGKFETTDYELAQRMKNEKGMVYGVRLDEVQVVPKNVEKIRKMKGIKVG